MGLGDSFTEGVGTHQDSTWLRFTEYALNHTLGPEQVITINGGSEGSDPVDAYMTLKELLLPFKPNLVIVAINATDLNDIITRGGFERFRPDYTKQYFHEFWWEPFYAVSHIFRNTIHLFKERDYTLLSLEERSIARKRAANTILETIDKFRKLSFENHFKLMLIFHPVRHQNLETGELNYIYGKAQADSSILAINLSEQIPDKSDTSRYYWKMDGHHTRAGYELWGTTVADYLLNHQVITAD